MNIFDIHSNITGAYEEYIRSFVNINGLMVSLEAKKCQEMEELLRTHLSVFQEVPERRILAKDLPARADTSPGSAGANQPGLFDEVSHLNDQNGEYRIRTVLAK